MRFFVSLLLLGVFSTTYAKPFDLTAKLLFLKPTIDETYYVISSSNNIFDGSTFPDGKRHQNCTSFTPGFRLEGRCNPCYDLKFTYLSADSRDSVSGDVLFDTNGYPGFNAQENGNMWRAIPAASTELGISYTFNCGTIEFGYKFASYSRCIDKVTGLDVAFAGDTLDNSNDFSLQGPYISITSTF